MSKLAQLIAKMEGFGVPGSIPTTHHNPGDLEHAPQETHDGTSPVGSFPDDATGWAMLDRQLQLYAGRGLTLQQLIYTYAPPEQNDTEDYLDFVCRELGCTPDTSVSDALKVA